MVFKNKEIIKLLIKCYEKRTPKEKDVLLKYFREVAIILIIAREVINIIEKNKKTGKRGKIKNAKNTAKQGSAI